MILGYFLSPSQNGTDRERLGVPPPALEVGGWGPGGALDFLGGGLGEG